MSGEFYTPINISDAQGTTKEEEATGEPFAPDRQPKEFQRTSRIHNRSFEDAEVSGNVLWGDEFGTKFMSRTVKGLPPEGKLPWIEGDSCTKSGVRVHYLCDEIDAVNTHYTSRVLREAGISTERMVRAKKLEVLEVKKTQLDLADIEYLGNNGISLETDEDSVNIPIEVLKEIMIRRLDEDLDRFRAEKSENVPRLFGELLRKSPQEIEEVKKHIRGTDFYYYERDLPVNERCWDLEASEKTPEVSGKFLSTGEFQMGDYTFDSKGAFEQFIAFMKETGSSEVPEYERLNELITEKMFSRHKVETVSSDLQYQEVLGKVFKYLNVAQGYELRIDNPEDIKKFYTEIQPRNMAQTLAKIHNMGLTHKYPGRLNWLAVGYLIDLDSVSGEMLGDAPITLEAVKKDLYKTADSLYLYQENNQVVMDPKSKEKSTEFHGHVAQIFGRREAINIADVAARTFFKTYIQERGLEEDWLKNIPNVGKGDEVKATG